MRRHPVTTRLARGTTTHGVDWNLTLHCHFRLDVRVRVVAFKNEVLVTECQQIGHFGIEQHLGKPARGARELQPGLLQMIEIEVGVTQGVH